MLAVGIDLGGHTMTAAVIDSDDSDRILAKHTVATPKARTLDKTTDAIASILKKLSPDDQVHYIGIAVPGFIDAGRSRVLGMPNFAIDSNIDLATCVKRKISYQNVEIKIENDANCAALGEGFYGVAKNCKDYAVLTLGSGIGCGIVANGELLTGAHGMAGEAGHIVITDKTIDCGCGGIGHLESLASADTAENTAKMIGINGDFKRLWDIRNKNEQAGNIVSGVLNAIAKGIASITVIIDPEKIVLNGGMSLADGFVAEVTDLAKRYIPRLYRGLLKVERSILGPDAAIYGATSLFRKR